MPLNIRRSASARQDQTDIWLFIATSNIKAADSLIDKLDSAFHMLAEYPEAGPVRPEYLDVRLYPVDHYNIFYRVSTDAIEITRILHAARDIKADLLLD